MPEPDLALLEAVARKAGEIALGYVGRPNAVREKPDGLGPVTEADLAVDRMLRETLLGARPDYGWLSEESVGGADRLAARRVFIVDPIDGTRAFLAGQRAWSHSLAVAENGRVVAGVVHLPMLGKTYAAAVGQGARRNDSPISVSRRETADGARVLASAGHLADSYWPGGAPAVERMFRPSIAYRLCLVADGAADAMLAFRDSFEWDIAAGGLIAAEAGAVVTDARGCGARLQPPASGRRRRGRRRAGAAPRRSSPERGSPSTRVDHRSWRGSAAAGRRNIAFAGPADNVGRVPEYRAGPSLRTVAETTMRQLLHLVFGGELVDPAVAPSSATSTRSTSSGSSRTTPPPTTPGRPRRRRRSTMPICATSSPISTG